MVAYAVAEVLVDDPVGFGQYAERTPPVLAKYGAKLIANDPAPVTVEGKIRKGSLVVIEFPDKASAQAFYADHDYVAAKKLREGAATLHVAIASGLD